MRQRIGEKVTGFIQRSPGNATAWVVGVGSQLQKQSSGFYGKIAVILISTWFLADIFALMASKYLPEPPAVTTRYDSRGNRIRTLEEYQVIFSRNLFNSKGLIPGDETPTQQVDLAAAPVRTSLPFNLVGTLILKDEIKSIATIEDKSASAVYPVRVQDEIPQRARILKIEPNRVIFINTQTSRKEFIDMPLDPAVSNPKITIRPAGGAGGIERVSPTQFNVSRVEVDKALSDLPQVLTQARCVPNFENGVAAGYKCFQIVPGSIYDKLGMQNGDTICGINSQNVDDPAKAFALLGELKSASHLELCIKRDGRQQTFVYDIR